MRENKSGHKKRLSLTKNQLLTDIGAELVSICNQITEDGVINEDELSELKSWLDENSNSELPSIEFLTHLINGFLKDGKVTKDELTYLYRSIESILPIEMRSTLVLKRRDFEKLQKDQLKAIDRELKAKQRENNRVLVSCRYPVAGINYHDRIELINEFVGENDDLFLVRDKSNYFSKTAVRICLRNGHSIGFVPEEYSKQISKCLDKNLAHKSIVLRLYVGKKSDLPIIHSEFYLPEAKIEGLIRNDVYPFDLSLALKEISIENEYDRKNDSRRGPVGRRNKETGCLVFLILIIVTLLIA